MDSNHITERTPGVDIRMMPINGRRDRTAQGQRDIAYMIEDTLLAIRAEHRVADDIKKVRIKARVSFGEKDQIRFSRIFRELMALRMAMQH